MADQRDTPGLAIVTGAAGGMGSAAVHRLAVQGWSLILCDIDKDRLEEIAGPLRASGKEVETIAGDIGDPAFLTGLIAALRGREIGALIHTAGVSPTMGDAARMFAVNYDAAERLVQTACPRMAEGGCAVIIASTSGHMMTAPEIHAAVNALTPGQGSSSLLKFAPNSGVAYAISKLAVIRLVAREAAAFGARKARIVSISPGLIDTSLGRAELAVSTQTGAMLAKTPLGRLGEGDEIASVAVFLCSPDASFISGCDIKVDGGMLAAMGL